MPLTMSSRVTRSISLTLSGKHNHTKYESCTSYKSEVTSKVKVADRETDKQEHVSSH